LTKHVTKHVCSYCKGEFKDKYFYLSIKNRERDRYGYSAGYKDSLRLRLCSWGCLEKVVANPKIIIVELL